MQVLLSKETHYHLHNTVMHVQALMNVVSLNYITPACTLPCLLCFTKTPPGISSPCNWLSYKPCHSITLYPWCCSTFPIPTFKLRLSLVMVRKVQGSANSHVVLRCRHCTNCTRLATLVLGFCCNVASSHSTPGQDFKIPLIALEST